MTAQLSGLSFVWAHFGYLQYDLNLVVIFSKTLRPLQVLFNLFMIFLCTDGYPRSCKDIKAAKSGLQTIRPDNSELEFQVG